MEPCNSPRRLGYRIRATQIGEGFWTNGSPGPFRAVRPGLFHAGAACGGPGGRAMSIIAFIVTGGRAQFVEARQSQRFVRHGVHGASVTSRSSVISVPGPDPISIVMR